MRYLFYCLILLVLPSCRNNLEVCYEINYSDVGNHYLLQLDSLSSTFDFYSSGPMLDDHLYGKWIRKGNKLRLIPKEGEVIKTKNLRIQDSIEIIFFDIQDSTQPLAGVCVQESSLNLDTVLEVGSLKLPSPAECVISALGYYDITYTFSSGKWNVFLQPELINKDLLKWYIRSKSLKNKQGHRLKTCK
jgi:hypothetical protein